MVSVGRNVEVLTVPLLLTQKELRLPPRLVRNRRGLGCGDNLMTSKACTAILYEEALAMFRDRFAAGHGGFPLLARRSLPTTGTAQCNGSGAPLSFGSPKNSPTSAKGDAA